jgi:hypothetical protein
LIENGYRQAVAIEVGAALLLGSLLFYIEGHITARIDSIEDVQASLRRQLLSESHQKGTSRQRAVEDAVRRAANEILLAGFLQEPTFQPGELSFTGQYAGKPIRWTIVWNDGSGPIHIVSERRNNVAATRRRRPISGHEPVDAADLEALDDFARETQAIMRKLSARL